MPRGTVDVSARNSPWALRTQWLHLQPWALPARGFLHAASNPPSWIPLEVLRIHLDSCRGRDSGREGCFRAPWRRREEATPSGLHWVCVGGKGCSCSSWRVRNQYNPSSCHCHCPACHPSAPFAGGRCDLALAPLLQLTVSFSLRPRGSTPVRVGSLTNAASAAPATHALGSVAFLFCASSTFLL